MPKLFPKLSVSWASQGLGWLKIGRPSTRLQLNLLNLVNLFKLRLAELQEAEEAVPGPRPQLSECLKKKNCERRRLKKLYKTSFSTAALPFKVGRGSFTSFHPD